MDYLADVRSARRVGGDRASAVYTQLRHLDLPQHQGNGHGKRRAGRPGDLHGPNAPTTNYWLWRFDRPDTPTPLDDFWGKSELQCVTDLDVAKNPQAGTPDGPADVELMVDPYFRDHPHRTARAKGPWRPFRRAQSASAGYPRQILPGFAHKLKGAECIAPLSNNARSRERRQFYFGSAIPFALRILAARLPELRRLSSRSGK